jgi:hypothetical protein
MYTDHIEKLIFVKPPPQNDRTERPSSASAAALA